MQKLQGSSEYNMENKKCKIDLKRKGTRIILKMSGYCDKDPNKQTNREIEFPDLERIEEVIES